MEEGRRRLKRPKPTQLLFAAILFLHISTTSGVAAASTSFGSGANRLSTGIYGKKANNEKRFHLSIDDYVIIFGDQ